MNASSAGIKAATLQVKSNDPDQPLISISQLLRTQRNTLALWVGTAFGILALVVLAARRSRRRYAS